MCILMSKMQPLGTRGLTFYKQILTFRSHDFPKIVVSCG